MEILPNDSIKHIISYLSIQNILQLSITNIKLKELCSDDYMWKQLLQRDFPEVKAKENKTAKDTYQTIYSQLKTLKEKLKRKETISQLYNLRILVLGSEQPLIKEIENLVNLRMLDISCRNLLTVPKGIRNLTNLQHLSLRFNRLTSIPSEIGNLVNLRKLNLSSNPSLRSLPKEIENLMHLEELNIKCCSIRQDQINRLERPGLRILD